MPAITEFRAPAMIQGLLIKTRGDLGRLKVSQGESDFCAEYSTQQKQVFLRYGRCNALCNSHVGVFFLFGEISWIYSRYLSLYSFKNEWEVFFMTPGST